MPAPVKVFVAGDSISMQYGRHLSAALGNGFAYNRKSGKEEAWNDPDNIGPNGGSSLQLCAYLEAMQDALKTDILLLNAGHHDIRRPAPTREINIDLEEYVKNLSRSISLGKKIARWPIWISTTVLDEERHNALNPKGVQRLRADDEAYDQKAREVMAEEDVPVLDLRKFTASIEGTILADHIHFTEDIQKRQATFIASWIKNFLKEKSAA